MIANSRNTMFLEIVILKRVKNFTGVFPTGRPRCALSGINDINIERLIVMRNFHFGMHFMCPSISLL